MKAMVMDSFCFSSLSFFIFPLEINDFCGKQTRTYIYSQVGFHNDIHIKISVAHQNIRNTAGRYMATSILRLPTRLLCHISKHNIKWVQNFFSCQHCLLGSIKWTIYWFWLYWGFKTWNYDYQQQKTQENSRLAL